jgi:hypothetical protein
MHKHNVKIIAMLLGLLLPTIEYQAKEINLTDGGNPIVINESYVQSTPKGTTIQASIDGHWLSVTFTQNIGTLTMELEKVSGPVIFNYPTVQTPDSYQFYLNQTGDYIITFTLSNGDEYYGEFTVTD